MRVRQLAGCLGAVLLTLAAAQETKPVEIARLPSFTEAPVIDYEGNLYVSEPYGTDITRISPNGDVSVWASIGNPNGHKILADGTHLVCDRKQHAVLRLSPQGENLGTAVTTCDGRPVREPNDLTLDPRGGFYFTAPGSMPEAREQHIGMICHVDADGSTRVVADELPFPNGIVLRPDGSRLLVSLSGTGQIVEFPVTEPGVVGEMKVFAERGSDGMALDEDGNLYVTGRGPDGAFVGVLDNTGELKTTYPVPMAFVSNMVFGGPDLRQLWVTGQLHPLGSPRGPDTGNFGLVYRLDLEGVRGLATLPPKQ